MKRNWLGQWRHNVQRSPGNRRRLLVEALEDRLAPATAVWSGAGANDLWTNPANWVGNVAPTANDDLVFPDAAARKASGSNDFTAGTAFRSFTFTGQGYVLQGNLVQLSAGASTEMAGGNNAINLALDLTSDTTVVVADGATLDVAGAVTQTGGPVSLVKEGTGTLRFGASVGLTGATTINGGDIFLVGNGTLATSTVSVRPGGGLVLDNSAVIQNDRIPNGAPLFLDAARFTLVGMPGGSVAEVVQGISLVGGANAIALSANNTAGSMLLLQAGSLARNGGATVQFTSAGLALGTAGDPSSQVVFTTPPTTAADSTIPFAIVDPGSANRVFATYGANGVEASTPTAFVNGTSNISVAARLTNNTTISANTTIGSLVAQNTTAGPMTVMINPGVTLTLAPLLTTANGQPITFTGSGTVRFLSAPGEAFVFAGASSTVFDLVITSTGALPQGLTIAGDTVFDGSTPNSYQGPTRVNAGTLTLQKDANVIAVPGDLIVGDGTGAAGADAVVVNAFGNLLTVPNPTVAPVTDPDFGTTMNPNFLVPATYGLVYTFVTPNSGETLPSPRETFTVPSNPGGNPFVPAGTVPSFPIGVVTFRVYMTQPDDPTGALFFYKEETPGTLVYDLTTAVPTNTPPPPSVSTAFADVSIRGGGTLTLPSTAGTTSLRNLTFQGGNSTGAPNNTAGDATLSTWASTLVQVGNVTVNAPDVTAFRFAGQAVLAGNVQLAPVGPANRTFTVADGAAVNDMLITAVLSAPTNDIDLVKEGAGTLLLEAMNTFPGDTRVNSGTVVVDGIAPGAVAGPAILAAAARLSGGLGMVTGTVESLDTAGVISAGQVAGPNGLAGAPNAGGTTRGILGVTNAAAFQASSTLTAEIAALATAGTDYDRLAVGGNLTIDPMATLILDLAGLSVTGTAMGVVQYLSRVGEFGTIQVVNNPNGFVVSVQYDADSLDVIVAPAPLPPVAPVVQASPPQTRAIRFTGFNSSTNLLTFEVAFDRAVTGVEVSDFRLRQRRVRARVVSVSGSGAMYQVQVKLLGGQGQLRLKLRDDNSIIDDTGASLGGLTVGDGNFLGPQLRVRLSFTGLFEVGLAVTRKR